jgi:hypothetical protein
VVADACAEELALAEDEVLLAEAAAVAWVSAPATLEEDFSEVSRPSR